MVSQLETATGHKNLSTGKMAASRADVGKSETSLAHERITAPDIPRVLNFEQQLKEIDDAINRSVSTINSIPNQEVLLGKESNMQAMHVTTLKLEERMQASGPNVITQAQPSMYGPQGTSHKPVHESKEDVGLFHSGASFNLGLASPK